MRSVSILVLACGVASARPPPSDPKAGWCPRPTSMTQVAPKAFAVSRDFKTVKPLWGGKPAPAMWTRSWVRGGNSPAVYTWLNPTIDGGKLQLSTGPLSCRHTGAGCIHHYWEHPGDVKLEDPVPKGACISYAFGTASAMVVGLGKEWRVFPRSQETLVKGTTTTVPEMDPIGTVEHKIVLQEPGGKLWSATDGSPAPTLTAGPTLGRISSLSYPTHGIVYAFTDAGLYLLDKDTLAVKTKIAGDIWSVTYQDVPFRHYVLAIEHGAKPRVVLREHDEAGKPLRSVVVYEGVARGATFGGSPDYTGFHVEIAP